MMDLDHDLPLEIADRFDFTDVHDHTDQPWRRPGQPEPPWGDLQGLPLEVVRYRVGPDRMWRGEPCSVSMVEYVRICSDPPAMPVFDLFPRLSRLARRCRHRG